MHAVVNHTLEHVNISEYRVFQGIHRSQEPGCDKRRLNDIDTDTIILRTQAIVSINVWLAQAHLN